eukprot:TRINITY_DN10598_c0_g1_i1.p1 TRINITY_DN10598_c0_g1~~TRINITY_DN10598_c0_g1_i1.p1  ORF type:complete len:416 (+),score=129.64 TRINITY_DN10598_c0_g1_i1:53-1300(+)
MRAMLRRVGMFAGGAMVVAGGELSCRRCAQADAPAPVWRVCLTGGPCGGKSSALTHLRLEFERLGYNVYIVPEAATLLFENGARTLFNAGPAGIHRFQAELLRTQVFMEDMFAKIARECKKKAVVLVDRGTMDGRVFCTQEQWQAIMEEAGFSTERLRDQRYDLVLLMATTAFGAEDVYNNQRLANPERTENAEEARAQEAKLREVYLGHPKLRVIDNSTSWNEKLGRARQAVLNLVGEAGTVGAYHKFRIDNPPQPSEIPVPYETVDTLVTMLQGSTPDREIRLYKRQSGSSTLYIHQTLVREHGEIQRAEEFMGRKAYLQLLEQADPNHHQIAKRSLCFMWDSQYFELALPQSPSHLTGAFLYTETQYADTSKGMKRAPRLPEWLSSRCKVKDVTRDTELSHFTLSKKGAVGA